MNTEKELNQINEAITAIETGSQEYTVNNRRLKRGDLSTLYKQRDSLKQQLASERNGGIGIKTFVARFDRR